MPGRPALPHVVTDGALRVMPGGGEGPGGQQCHQYHWMAAALYNYLGKSMDQVPPSLFAHTVPVHPRRILLPGLATRSLIVCS